VNFFRQLGGAIIVAVFGAIAFGSRAGGQGLTLETLSGSALAFSASAFQSVFLAAALGVATALAFLIAMEERPLKERPAAQATPLE
jgi:hypothetical protein